VFSKTLRLLHVYSTYAARPKAGLNEKRKSAIHRINRIYRVA